jgi:hypothetical protein
VYVGGPYGGGSRYLPSGESTLVPLYEIDVVKEAEPYKCSEEAAILELGRAREALERELAVL